MEAMVQLVVWVVGGGLFLYFVGTLGMNLERDASKRQKLEMMRQHPEHAVQIQQAIDMEDRRFKERLDSCFARKPKRESGALRLGVDIARRLLK
jgi:hypothetical protein